MEGEVEDLAREEQASRMADDPWLDLVQNATWGVQEITIREILRDTIGMLPADMLRDHSNRVGALLARLGWKRADRVTAGEFKGQARFIPPE